MGEYTGYIGKLGILIYEGDTVINSKGILFTVKFDYYLGFVLISKEHGTIEKLNEFICSDLEVLIDQTPIIIPS